MSGVWFTADTHFGHRAMAADGKGWRPFATVSDHDEHLIARWNRLVAPDDVVWHLGDVGLSDTDHVLDCVSRLNGTKHLIAGNHDPCWSGHQESHKHQPRWLQHFATIQSFARRRISGREVLLSHFPYTGDHTADARFDQYRLSDQGLPLIHGHVHDAWLTRGRQLNVGVDVHDWSPINIATVARHLQRFDQPDPAPSG